jgi:di/tricarboxylate transporter
VLCWTLDVLPDYVVALGVLVVWNVTAIGPSAPSLSGFASPVWFLLLGVLAVGGGLARSALLQRIAFALLSMFPATFAGQVVAFLVGGLVMTPLLPLTVARCALTAPLARQVAEVLGYPARSRAAVGIGLAAFTGNGLLSRVFLSGATLNLEPAAASDATRLVAMGHGGGADDDGPHGGGAGDHSAYVSSGQRLPG